MRRSFARRVGVLVTVTAAIWVLSPDARGWFGSGATSLAAPSPVAADALLENQWHLKDRSIEIGGANVRDAWPMSTGAGVVIGIVDDGLQWTHPDLSPNYLASASFDFNFNDADPTPNTLVAHGTAVAGLAAGRGDNTIGISGVAPQASLAGLRLTALSATDAQEASAFGFQPDVIHILNNSWNPSDNGTTLKAPGPLAAAARQSAATTGRQGKGRIFVWSAGNGRLVGDDCNFDGYANSRFAIAVGASTDAGIQYSTSEGCSALMVLAPAAGATRPLTTTDLIGTPGYDASDYTSAFGTSSTGGMNAAAPTVSGAAALMLARNPNLKWRDVQHILRLTSVRITPTDPGWTSAAFPHNERLGFGLLDAEAAVTMAGTWSNVPAEEVLAPATRTLNLPIPDINTTGVSDTITISGAESNFVIEHVEVDFNATHTWRGDIQVKLTSPSGVVSNLAPIRPADSGDNFTNWKFGSVRHWGETAAGVWTLNVADRRFQDVGTWNNWTLRVYGYHTSGSAPAAFGKSLPGSGTAGVSTSPTLSWSPSSGATSYEYCYDTTNDGACSSWIGNGTNTSAALSGLAANMTYYWQVRAANATGSTYAQGSSTAFWSFSTAAGPALFSHSSPANGATGQALASTLSWTPSSGATSYEYCYDTSNNTACNASWVSSGSATSVGLSGLAAGTAYYWHVRALNAVGTMYAEGSASSFWSFTTVGAPGAFTHASPANGATGQSLTPVLSWNASSGAASYEYCYDTTNDGACSAWTSTGANTSAGLSGLAAGATYYWHVRAANTGGTTYAEGAPSTFWSFTTIALPAAFSHSSPGNGATGQSLNPTLTWSASSGATSYEYCYDTSNNSTCNASWISVGTATSAGLSGLTAGTPYYWHVRANNAAGTTYADGASSSFWSFTPLALPASFSHNSPGNGAIAQSLNPSLSWGASTGATSYEYCYDTTNDNACSGWTSNGASTSVALSGLSAGTSYYWHVRANNTGGATYADGAATSFWGFTTLALPGAFSHSSPANGASGQSVNPTLSWGAAAGATGYEYCFDTINDGNCGGGWTSAGANTSVALSGLAIGTQYFWQVRATNSGGMSYAEGATSSYWNFTTLAAPGLFNRTSPANGAMNQSLNPTLSWQASAAAATYEYCIDTTNDSACANWISTGSNTSIGLTGLTAGTIYWWQVRATNASGTTYGAGGASNFWGFTTLALPTGFNRLGPSNGATGQSLNPTLSWSSSNGAASYQYCVDTTNDSACSAWTSTGTNTSVGLTGLTAGTTYYWHAKAINASGITHADGSATAFWSFTTQVNAPAAFGHTSPANGAAGLTNSPTLSWSASSGAASFEYCIDTTNNNACDATWTSTGTNTSVALSNLAFGTAHYWQVRAINPGGTTYAEGAAAAYWTLTTQVAVPGAFGRTSPANGATGQLLNPTLSWGASASATSYEYCIDTTNDGACASWISTGSNTSAGLSGLTAGTIYFWQVRATNVAGTTYGAGGATNFWGFTTLALPGAFNPGSPANGATGQSLNPTLSWGTSTTASSYEYCVDTTNDSACSGWASTGTNTSVALSNLNAGTTYYWHVRANNAVGTTYAGAGATAFSSFTTQVGAPGAFGHTSPANGATGQSTSPTLSWGTSTGATSYEYCIDATDNDACSAWTSTGTSTSVALSGLTAGTPYFWHVRAINPGGTIYAAASATAFWSFTTQVAAPGAFAHTSPANGATGQSNSPTLSWSLSAGAASFEYCVDTTNDNACGGWTSTGTSTSVALSGLTAGTPYYWQVRAINPGGTTYAEGAAAAFWIFTTQVAAPAAFSHTSPANGATGQSTSPTLSWGASAGAASYQYCFDATNDGACSAWTSTGTGTSVALNGLTADTPYYWHVRAINPGGTTYAEATTTAFWSFTTQVGAPGAFGHTSPANGATGQSTSPTLSWGTSAGATSYEYCFDTTNNNACSGWTSTGTSTSVALSNLIAGTSYYWHVRAINPGGTIYAEASTTAFWSFTTQVSAPGAFGHTSPANGATGQSTSPTLSWGSSAGATSYEYCFDTTNNNACSGWTSTGTSTSAALSGLAAGTPYYWHVRAINPGGTTYAEASATAFWSFTTQVGAPGAFGHTSPANGATGMSTSPTLSWGTSAGATSYEYCVDTTNNNACSGWASNGTSTSVALSNLIAGTSYYWHVRAINPGGTIYAEASATAFWSFTTQVALPGSFTKSSPANGATGLPTSVTLSWAASTGATGYEVCFDTTNDNACTGWTSTGTNTSAVLNGLSESTAYYWHVRAGNAGGVTYAESNPVMFWEMTTVTSAPGAFGRTSPLNGALKQLTNPTLAWTGSAGAEGYEYCIDSSNNSACDATWTSTGANTSVALSNLSADATFYWHVRAINTGGTTYADGVATAYWNFTTRTARRAIMNLNGDAEGDVFTYNPATGAWARQVTTPGGGFEQGLGTWGAGWTTQAAMFDEDELTDFFVFNPADGAWFKMLNTGSGFVAQSSSAWWPGWQKFVLDLDGDAISDVFLFDPATGHWFKAISTLAGFDYYDGWWSPGWEITPTDLNADAFADLFLIDRTTGMWYWVLGEAGGGFTYPQVGYWAPDWTLHAGDFNGDGRSDFFLYRPAAGEYYVAMNNGAGYTYTAGYGWAAGWTLTVADLNGDLASDLFLYNRETGKWVELEGDGAGHFASVGEGAWTAGWTIRTTDFNDDGRTDLLLYKSPTGEWFQAVNLAAGSFTYFGGQWQPGLQVMARAPVR